MQQTRRCPNCGSPNTADQKFCGSCGSKLGASCPNCGAQLESNDHFCGICGAQVTSQGAAPQQPAWNQPPPPPPPPQTMYNPQPRAQQWSGQQSWGQQQSGMYGVPGGMGYQGGYGNMASRRQSTPLVILLVVLILALGGFAYWSFLGTPPWAGSTSTLQIKTGPFIHVPSEVTGTTCDINITWETNIASTGKVEYGTSTAYGSSSNWESAATKNHSITLTGLQVDTSYSYRIYNRDAENNEIVSSNFSFKTPAPTE